jgi:hypothetical protein
MHGVYMLQPSAALYDSASGPCPLAHEKTRVADLSTRAGLDKALLVKPTSNNTASGAAWSLAIPVHISHEMETTSNALQIVSDTSSGHRSPASCYK